jgi:hypothetical protein
MEPRCCNRWQPDANETSPKAAQISQKPLPWVATRCRSERMVRRVEVRVRQRALQKPRTAALFRSRRIALLAVGSDLESRVENQFCENARNGAAGASSSLTI